MMNTDTFMTALAKIMNEDSGEVFAKELQDQLHVLVNEKLYDILEDSLHPQAPEILEMLNDELEDIGVFSMCRELNGRNNYLFSFQSPEQGFSLLKNVLESIPEVRFLAGIPTTIPLMVVPSLEYKIEAFTYANRRIAISMEEYAQLLLESDRAGIALEQIVRMFIICLPMKQETHCFVFDNRSCSAGAMLHNHIQLSVYVPHQGEIIINRQNNASFDFVWRDNINSVSLRDGNNSQKCKEMTEDVLMSSITQDAKKTVCCFGYVERFRYISAELESYYERRRNDLLHTKLALTSDIVKSSDEVEIMKELRKEEEEIYGALKSEQERIRPIIKEISSIYEEIDRVFAYNIPILRNTVFANIDDMLSQMFLYSEAKMISDMKTVIKNISITFPLYKNILNRYAQERNKENLYPNESDSTGKELTWGVAKVYLSTTKITTIPRNILQKCIGVLQASSYGIRTGKEYFACAQLCYGEKRISFLKKSMELGYDKAGIELMNEYRGNSYSVDVKELADMLIPEACYILGERELKAHNGNKNKKLSFGDTCLIYHKIAASQEYYPSIISIVEAIYTSKFRYKLSLIDDHSKKEAAYLCAICQYLVRNHHNEKRYRQLAGVLLFHQKQYVEAYRLLNDCTLPEAHYFRGLMYENGQGTNKDLNRAVTEYQKVVFNNMELSDMYHDTVKRIENIKERQYNEKKESQNSYNSSQSYSSSKTVSSSYSDGCFITTAACLALIESDDCVELNTMRHFRDTYLKNTEEGRQLVTEYYRIAPEIVERINSDANKKEIYLNLWNQYISYCYDAIIAGDNLRAKDIYIDMVRALCSRYGVTVQEHIAERYDIPKTENV